MELFSLKNEHALDKPIHKIDFSKFSPNSLATINNNNSNISISLPREGAYNCLQNLCIPVDFEILMQDDTRYADGDKINLYNFGDFALFSEAKLTTSSGKQWKKVDKLPIISIMHNV